MKTLIYGAGPIGRWLALRMHQADQDVTLLARNLTYRSLEKNGIEIVDGLTGERLVAGTKLVERLDPEDRYDLVVVVMHKSGRMAVCPILAGQDMALDFGPQTRLSSIEQANPHNASTDVPPQGSPVVNCQGIGKAMWLGTFPGTR